MPASVLPRSQNLRAIVHLIERRFQWFLVFLHLLSGDVFGNMNRVGEDHRLAEGTWDNEAVPGVEPPRIFVPDSHQQDRQAGLGGEVDQPLTRCAGVGRAARRA